MIFIIVSFYKNLTLAGCRRAKTQRRSATTGVMPLVSTFLGFDSKKLERPWN
jgi:hypothetical protein